LADFRARKIGFIFQFASLLPNLRAIDNVALPALIDGATGHATASDRARELLQQVGLGDRWDAFPGELSGGQQRRVAIARALINRPPLLLADEPTGDLDEQTEAEIVALLRDWHRTHQATLIFVTHNTHLARDADRILHLRHGRLVSASLPSAGASPVPMAPAEPRPPVLAPAEPTPLGAGLGRFLAGFLGWTVAVTLAIGVMNYVAARFQKQSVEHKQESRRQVEQLALQALRADLENVSYRPDGSYLLSLYLAATDPGQPVYVLGPSLRAFVQVGRSWQEIPIFLTGRPEGQVQRIAERQVFDFVFRADLETYEQILKGYMHVRLTDTLIVSTSPEPGRDLFERTDDYYIFLKPQKVSEEKVRKLNGWKEGALVPRWVPMPAH
jgi:putative ABC transport system ATP-binding protein/macrolide transport system ATP-binding/permease protein/lipoprotein-releasing system ATP-binding protein